jgi:hypothetical protein
MKKFFKIIATLFFTFAIIALMLPGTVSAAASAPSVYPTSINGLPVIFVQTAANTSSLNAGEKTSSVTNGGKIITLLDDSSSSMQESASKFSSDIDSVKALIKPGDMIEVYGGPGASEGQFDMVHAANNKSWSPTQFHEVPSAVVNQASVVSPDTAQFYQVMAIDQDNDTATHSPILAISAHFPGITIGNYQNGYSGLLVNGLANGTVNYHNQQVPFFLQSGQLYRGGQCYNVWVTTNDNPNVQDSAVQFNLPYYLNHDYAYEVDSLGSQSNPGIWWLGVTDNTDNGAFDYVITYSGAGYQLVWDPNTSVFFENDNTSGGQYPWYTGFPNSIKVSEAADFTTTPTYHWQNWSYENQEEILNDGQTTYPLNGAITGHLINNLNAWWYPSLIMPGIYK